MSVEIRCAADIPAEPVSWLWDGWLASGKLHILAGPPGAGKTTLTIGIAATITSGGRWPDGKRSETGSVAIWSGEDAASDTLVPRLRANGAGLSRCHFIGPVTDGGHRRPFDPAKDVPLLALQLARIPDLRLLIVDPVVSAVSGDAHKSNDVRRGLQPLSDFAEQSGVAIVGISHFSKGSAGKDPVERVTGSIAFGAAPRIVLGAAKRDEEQGGGRILVRTKNNIGPDNGGFVYDLDLVDLPAGIQTTRIVWKEVLEGSARALLAYAENSDDAEARSDLAAAKDFLAALLADGPVPSKLIRQDAEDAGHSWATIRRAQNELGVDARKVSMKDGWVWELIRTAPSKMLMPAEHAHVRKVSNFAEDAHVGQPAQEDAHLSNMSTFENDEHLRESDASDGEVF
jgi:putative DNA primase/helicase